MATPGYDVIQGAIVAEENTNSTWFKEPQNFARSERRCVRRQFMLLKMFFL